MARALWSGTVTFGLVNIPVKLFTAVRDQSIHFHMLTPDGSCRLRRKLYCPETNREYDFGEAAKGYEVSPGQYLIIDQEQIRLLRPEKGEDLAIEQFVAVSEIDPIYFDRTYYLAPDKGGKRAYRLLHAALQDTDKVALGQFVMHSKQHFVAMRPFNDVLLVHTLHYADDIVSTAEIPGLVTDPAARVAVAEKKMARQLLDSMTAPFRPEQYQDDFTLALRELLEQVAQGKQVKTPSSRRGAATDNVVNLMDALKKSLTSLERPADDRGKKDKPGTRKKRPARKAGAQ